MPGTNPASIGNIINRHGASGKGVAKSYALPDPLLWSAYDTAATPDLQGLAGTLTVAGYAADKCGAGMANGLTTVAGFNVLQFNGTTDSAHSLACEITLNDQYYVPSKSTDPKRVLKINGGVRQVGSGSVTVDQTLKIDIYAKVPGDATYREVVPLALEQVLSAKVSTLTFDAWEVDIGTLAEQAGVEDYLVPGSKVKIVISITEAAGTNMAIEVVPDQYLVREHLRTTTATDAEPLV
jgi:hypothetical protein